MKTAEIVKLSKRYIMNTYGERSIALVKGKGAYVWDADGKKYLDFLSGIAVNALGHCHPEIVEAVKKQVSTLIHVSNLYHIKQQAELAELLIKHSFKGKCFFCNSGAEANEAAIKLARKATEPGKSEIITMTGSFHGRTLATITATDNIKYQKGIEPLPGGFKRAVFNDIGSVKKCISDKTCAIMIEPVQGESGIYIAKKDFMIELRKLCDERKIFLIFDEIQCGLGRTGKLFAYEHYNIEPDMITLAKSLGSGLPIGALIAKDKTNSGFEPGDHASTFGGNPLCCAAALTTLKIILKNNFSQHAWKMGAYFKNKLEALKKKYSFIREIRGIGLMIGVELDFECKEIVEKCQKAGLLINCASDNVLRFLPPFIVSEKDIDKAVNILKFKLRRL
ncbi:aspartate aminotransferase family protein [bacterium]|nr:aspartate aminotransferase family protein [bacterium]